MWFFQNGNELASPEQSVQNETMVEFINIELSKESVEEEAIYEDNENTMEQANEKNVGNEVSEELESNIVSMNLKCLFVTPIG